MTYTPGLEWRGAGGGVLSDLGGVTGGLPLSLELVMVAVRA